MLPVMIIPLAIGAGILVIFSSIVNFVLKDFLPVSHVIILRLRISPL